jgi:hypothetical protein
MSSTEDRSDPRLQKVGPDGQQEAYLVLSREERAKGFVRPVRSSYRHVGIRPEYPTRPLTEDEQLMFESMGYVVYEEYPPDSSLAGRYWTQAQLDSGCGAVTTMGDQIAETYAREPGFYGATYCSNCKTHLPVEQFVWTDGGTRVGT